MNEPASGRPEDGESTPQSDSPPVELAQPATPPEVVADEPARAAAEEQPEVRTPEPMRPEPPPAAERAAAPAAVPPPRRGGFLGSILGGAIAVAGGYGLATFAPLPGQQQQAADLDARLAAQQEAIAALSAQLDRLAQTPAPEPVAPPELLDRLAAIEATVAEPPPETDLTPVTAALTALQDRLSAIEALPAGESGNSAALVATLESLRGEVESLRASSGDVTAEIAAAAEAATARVAEAEAQAAALKAEAEEAGRRAMAQAAAARIAAALDSGAPYGGALADLGDAAVPEVLAAHAEAGLPTDASLAAAFPEPARAALDASLKATMGSTWSERAGAFLRSTTGARSTVPREGDDPDAVLSRAEAAVRSGETEAALAEIAALPEAGQAALADWVALANTRLEAEAAVAALAAEVDR